MKNWYLIQTKPQQEAIATLNLSDQGYTVFHPKVIIKGKISPYSQDIYLFSLMIKIKIGHRSVLPKVYLILYVSA